jgi:hypothetical protein
MLRKNKLLRLFVFSKGENELTFSVDNPYPKHYKMHFLWMFALFFFSSLFSFRFDKFFLQKVVINYLCKAVFVLAKIWAKTCLKL